jgi:hypothetical protein
MRLREQSFPETAASLQAMSFKAVDGELITLQGKG